MHNMQQFILHVRNICMDNIVLLVLLLCSFDNTSYLCVVILINQYEYKLQQVLITNYNN